MSLHAVKEHPNPNMASHIHVSKQAWSLIFTIWVVHLARESHFRRLLWVAVRERNPQREHAACDTGHSVRSDRDHDVRERQIPTQFQGRCPSGPGCGPHSIATRGRALCAGSACTDSCTHCGNSQLLDSKAQSTMTCWSFVARTTHFEMQDYRTYASACNKSI
eukprot:365810-Chlamydomonas_euryale.AAC.12